MNEWMGQLPYEFDCLATTKCVRMSMEYMFWTNVAMKFNLFNRITNWMVSWNFILSYGFCCWCHFNTQQEWKCGCSWSVNEISDTSYQSSFTRDIKLNVVRSTIRFKGCRMEKHVITTILSINFIIFRQRNSHWLIIFVIVISN